MYNIAIKSIDFIRGYTAKQIRLENISRCNYFYAVKRHEWRYRLREMFEVLGLKLPVGLHNELTGGLSVVRVAYGVLVAMGLSSVYLLWQKYRVVRDSFGCGEELRAC